MTTGELTTELGYLLNADGSQVDDSVFRAKTVRATQRACDRAWGLRPMSRRYVSSTVSMTTGVGSVPTNFGSAGPKLSVWVGTYEVEYRDPEDLEILLQTNPNETSDRPRYYTLRGQSAAGRLQVYTYPPNSSAVTLKFRNYIEKPPVLVDRPDACIAAEGGTGLLDGLYTYRITFVTADGETEGGVISNLISVALKAIELTNIPVSAASTVTSRKIYRTAAGGEQHKLVATLSDNVTTTYSDNVDDVSLGDNVPTVATAISGLEKFPAAYHRTAILESAMTLLARNQGDGRSGGEFPQAAMSALAQMWAEEQIHHVPRRQPRYGRRSA